MFYFCTSFYDIPTFNFVFNSKFTFIHFNFVLRIGKMKIKSGAEKKHLKLAAKLNLLGCDLKQTIIIYFGNHIIKEKARLKT